MEPETGNHEPPYNPTWHSLIKDVHLMDKEVTILKIAHQHMAQDMADLKSAVAKSTETLGEVRDTIMGWKGSLVVITSVGGAVAATVFYFLNKFLGVN